LLFSKQLKNFFLKKFFSSIDKKDAPKKRTPSFHDSDSKSLNTEKKKYGFLTLRKGLKKDRSSVDIGECMKFIFFFFFHFCSHSFSSFIPK